MVNNILHKLFIRKVNNLKQIKKTKINNIFNLSYKRASLSKNKAILSILSCINSKDKQFIALAIQNKSLANNTLIDKIGHNQFSKIKLAKIKK